MRRPSAHPRLAALLILAIIPGLLASLPPQGAPDGPDGSKPDFRADLDRLLEERVGEILREKSGRTFRKHTEGRYRIWSDSKDKALDSYARNLERRALKIAEALGVTLPADDPKFDVIQFEKRGPYQEFCRNLGLEEYAVAAPACFVRRADFRPIVIYGPGYIDLFHEAAHQIADRHLGMRVGDVPWVSEGLAAVLEVVPPENFIRSERYRTGREAILADDFDLEAFATDPERGDTMYEVGGAISRALLFGLLRDRWLAWLRAVGQGESDVSDLPEALGTTWPGLTAWLREFCRKNPPPGDGEKDDARPEREGGGAGSPG